MVGTDSFRFRLVDPHGALSVAAGTLSLDIVSGVDVRNVTATVDEEALAQISVKGINQRDGSTWFTVTSLPAHGTLFQLDGSPISAPGINISDAKSCADEAGWLCPRLLYRGDADYFSFPTHTYDGTRVGNSDDTFSFAVSSLTETSVDGYTHVVVRNVNDPPVLTVAGNLTFRPRVADAIFGGIRLSDPDLGVGFYQLQLSIIDTNGPSLKAPDALKQGGTLVDGSCWAGGGAWSGGSSQSAPYDRAFAASGCPGYDRFQSQIDFIVMLIGYCPPQCAAAPPSTSCRATLCLQNADGQGNDIKFFATPATAERVLRGLTLTSSSETAWLRVSIWDFDDGHSKQRYPTSAYPTVVTVVENVVTGCHPSQLNQPSADAYCKVRLGFSPHLDEVSRTELVRGIEPCGAALAEKPFPFVSRCGSSPTPAARASPPARARPRSGAAPREGSSPAWRAAQRSSPLPSARSQHTARVAAASPPSTSGGAASAPGREPTSASPCPRWR